MHEQRAGPLQECIKPNSVQAPYNYTGPYKYTSAHSVQAPYNCIGPYKYTSAHSVQAPYKCPWASTPQRFLWAAAARTNPNFARLWTLIFELN